MNKKRIYDHAYGNSWALIIGINDYKILNPLNYACSDARAVQEVLIDQFDFAPEKTILLLDSDATKASIEHAYLDFAKENIKADDRILFFFAGHGHTLTGIRGPIGYLVPYDGDNSEVSTLIRWSEITGNSELIQAKHILYVMDACYSGLAFTRHVSPGSVRFVNSMLERLSRQVITAGKADETVSDAGGPRPEHSVFTGHFLDALENGIEASDCILTANQVMAYVYSKVATDYQSNQTPHYGHIDGDGDFIFTFPNSAILKSDDQEDKGVLVQISPKYLDSEESISYKGKYDKLKEYLSEPRYRIALDDYINAEIRRIIPNLSVDQFPVQNISVNQENFQDRLFRYEEIVDEFIRITALLGRWTETTQRATLENVFARVSDVNSHSSGTTVWLGFRWYPITLLMYAGGIASLKAGNYENLASVFLTETSSGSSSSTNKQIIQAAVDGMQDIIRAEFFKRLPDHDKLYVPVNEYLYRTLLPQIEEVIYLGNEYEDLFDKYEAFQGLVYADINYDEENRIWGPLGRYAYKFNNRGRITESNPFSAIVAEAKTMKDDWPPLKYGLFKGSYDRFATISNGLSELMRNQNLF